MEIRVCDLFSAAASESVIGCVSLLYSAINVFYL